MAITKIDSSMLEDVSGANNLVKLDANAKIPAGTGANLLNKPGPFTSASDPAIDSNKSLGDEWLNTTDGEMFICTDATAGENVWTNVGAGTGDILPWVYGGTNYGFVSGGYISGGTTNQIQKFSLSSDANAVDTNANLTASIGYVQGTSSSTHGYAMGGRVGSTKVNTIDKFAMVSTANASDIGNLTVARERTGTTSSSTHGYTAGGNAPPNSDVIDKFPFATDSNATDVGNLTLARPALSGQSSETYGYVSGGDGPQARIDKWSYASDGNSSNIGDITVAREKSGGCSSSTYGYVVAGISGSGGNPPFVNIIERFSFTTDGDGVDVGDLPYTLTDPTGVSSATYGYTAGGGYPWTDYIIKFSFATGSEAGSDIANLNLACESAAGAHY